jgi:hypothetical protein
MHAAAAPSSNQPFFLELQRTMYYKTQKTTTTPTTCSFFWFGNKCRDSAAKFLDRSRTSKTPFDFSFKEKTTKKKQSSFFLSLRLSLLMRLAQAKRAENKQRAESDKE